MRLYDAINTLGLGTNYVLRQGGVQRAIFPAAEPQSLASFSWHMEPRAVEELIGGLREGR